MAKSPDHIRHHPTPRITANDLARYVVSTETGKIGIIRRARESVTAPRLRYRDAREATRAYLGDLNRKKAIIYKARDEFERRTTDPSLTDFVREDAKLSMDVLDALLRMDNQLAAFEFATAPRSQKKLELGGVDVSVNVDLLTLRTKGSDELIGGALFRFTKADDETDAAASKRREIGGYAATLVQMQVRKNLAGNRKPNHALCMSIDVQCEEVHIAPRTYAQKAQHLENACRFIAAMWDKV